MPFSSAAQQRQCQDAEQWLRGLYDNYQEVVIWRGFGSTGTTVIITANNKTGSWTIGVLLPQEGVICTQADGIDFELPQTKAET